MPPCSPSRSCGPLPLAWPPGRAVSAAATSAKRTRAAGATPTIVPVRQTRAIPVGARALAVRARPRSVSIGHSPLVEARHHATAGATGRGLPDAPPPSAPTAARTRRTRAGAPRRARASQRVTSCPASGCEKIDCGYKPKWADTDSRGCRKYGAAWGHCKGMGAGSLYAGACSNANLSYHCWRNTSWTKPCTVYGDWCCGGCEHAGLVLTGCPAYAPGRGGCEPDGKSHCMCGNSSCKGPPDDDHGDQKANCNCTQATCNKPVGSWCGGGCQVCGWHNTQGCPGSATCRGVSGMGCQGCVSWPNCRDYWQDPCGYAGQCGDPNCI
jgi:hypothetical protein